MALTQITGTRDGMASVPAVIVEHLAGSASYHEMLCATDPHGNRACVLDRVELPALESVLRDAGLADVADDLAETLRHIPADLIGWRRVVVSRDHETGWLYLAAVSATLPLLVVDLWLAYGPLENAVIVRSGPPELTEWTVYRDKEACDELLTARMPVVK